jgi:hypothetical protein
MSNTTNATSLSASQVEELANQIFTEQGRDVLIISVFREQNRPVPHWLIRWSETGITRQALVELTPGMAVGKFRDLLVRAIKNAALG